MKSVFDQMGFDKLDNFGKDKQEKIDSGFDKVLDQIGLERALLHFEKEEAHQKKVNPSQEKKPIREWIATDTETGEQMPFKVWCKRWVDEAIDGHHIAKAK